MTEQPVDLTVIIPESIYMKALTYLPVSLTDTIFDLTHDAHKNMVVTSSLDNLDKNTEATTVRLIEDHYKSRVPASILYLPLTLEVIYLTFLMFNRMLTPTILILTSLAALLASSYIFLKFERIKEQRSYAFLVFRNIELLTALTVNNELRKQLIGALTQNESVLTLIKNDMEEITTRYEAAINYFYKVDPKTTNRYLETISQTPIRVLYHETIQ